MGQGGHYQDWKIYWYQSPVDSSKELFYLLNKQVCSCALVKHRHRFVRIFGVPK